MLGDVPQILKSYLIISVVIVIVIVVVIVFVFVMFIFIVAIIFYTVMIVIAIAIMTNIVIISTQATEALLWLMIDKSCITHNEEYTITPIV